MLQSHNEELAPFAYTCHNFQVSGCLAFEESALFAYTCRNCEVPRQAEIIQRCDPRCKNKGLMNSCFNHIRRIRSVRLQYTCRSFQVPGCLAFEESAPFSYILSQLRLSITIWKRLCVRASSALHLACIIWKRVCVRVFSALHLACIRACKSSQIGIWCSGTKKCSQRHEIGHFCKGNISAIWPSEILS